MAILLSFLPFIVFAVLLHLGHVQGALWAGAAIAGLLLIRDKLVLRRSIKILEAATLVLFAGLALYTRAADANWTIPEVRFIVDLGLLIIVAGSLLLGKPFTLQYAREDTAKEYWGSPEFMRLNRRITSVWALAFAMLVAADATMVWMPLVPHAVSILVTVAALFGAYKYTAQATPRDTHGAAA